MGHSCDRLTLPSKSGCPASASDFRLPRPWTIATPSSARAIELDFHNARQFRFTATMSEGFLLNRDAGVVWRRLLGESP